MNTSRSERDIRAVDADGTCWVDADAYDQLRAALVEIRDGAPDTDYRFTYDDDAIVPMNIARKALGNANARPPGSAT